MADSFLPDLQEMAAYLRALKDEGSSPAGPSPLRGYPARAKQFEKNVKARMGPWGNEVVDVTHAYRHPTANSEDQLSLRGVYIPTYGKTGHKFYPYDEETDRVATLPVDSVNTFGKDVNNAGTWAHEFRHRKSTNMTENHNRIIDAWSARTPAEWKEEVQSWGNRVGIDDYDKAEENLKTTVQQYDSEIRDVMWPEKGFWAKLLTAPPFWAATKK